MFKIAGLLLLMLSPVAIGETIYNGESHPFSLSAKWDSNESTLIQKSSNASSFSAPNYLRATINVAEGWGGVSYVINNWKDTNMSKALFLQFAAKSPKDVTLAVQLYDANKISSKKHLIDLTKQYEFYKIPMDKLSGVDPFTIRAIVFSITKGGTVTHLVDIDNIETIDDLDAQPLK